MSAVCIVDTSVFCEILDIPHMATDRGREFRSALTAKVKADETLLLPMTTILETGNHIGQNGNGAQRRAAASRFVTQVTLALRGETPFTPTPLLNEEALLEMLGKFPDWAMKEKGFGDLTIVEEWISLCEAFPTRRVYIWSKDGDFDGYDREP